MSRTGGTSSKKRMVEGSQKKRSRSNNKFIKSIFKHTKKIFK